MSNWRGEIEKSEYSNRMFSKIGRLLYIGSIFELNCKLIDTRLTLNKMGKEKENKDKTGEELFFDLYEKTTLNNSINRVFKEGGGLREILHNGRLVRNEIAHLLLVEFSIVSTREDKQKEFEEKLKEKAFSLVRAYLVSLDVLDNLLKNEPTESDINSLLDWIF